MEKRLVRRGWRLSTDFMKQRRSNFKIIREDRTDDPVTIVTRGLKIGRELSCDLVLNHPTVSRLHAGIRQGDDGRFYIVSLSRSNSTTLNDRLIAAEHREALADGDVIRIGPFFLHVWSTGDELELRVTLQFGLMIGDVEAREQEEYKDELEARSAVATSSEEPDVLALFWGKRTRDKMVRPTPLHPLRPPRLGKARFNWTPTRDLIRPWPVSIYIWSVIVVGLLSGAAALWYASAYSPAPLSKAHSRQNTEQSPAIAIRANAGSCTTCHSLNVSIADKCASCHEMEAFVSTGTNAHNAAGIDCTMCHPEHRGSDFRPMEAALRSCSECHNDSNRKLYRGKSVSTPHGGTIGYPALNGQWIWKGLEEEALATRPEIAKLRLPEDTEQQWRSKQFHALHLYRVRAIAGILGIEGDVISCSSCHRSFGAEIDRDFPRTTCSSCHTGRADQTRGGAVIADGEPNCTSCHVQHPKDTRHWNPSLLAKASDGARHFRLNESALPSALP